VGESADLEIGAAGGARRHHRRELRTTAALCRTSAPLDPAVHLDAEGRRAAARFPNGAIYFLARGPLPERGFVYVVVPEAKRAQLETLTPLATIQVTARVRTGRTRFSATRCRHDQLETCQ